MEFKDFLRTKNQLIKVVYHNQFGRFSQLVTVEIPRKIMKKYYKTHNEYILIAEKALKHYCLRAVKQEFKKRYNDIVEDVSIIETMTIL